MGRDVTGLRFDKLSMINVKSNGVSQNSTPEKAEMKDQESDDRIVGGRHPDEINQKQDVLGIKSTNRVPVEKIIQAETQKSTDKSPVKLVSGSVDNGSNDANSSEPVTPVVYANGDETNGSVAKFSPNHDDTHTPKTANKSLSGSPNVSAKQQHSHYKKFYDDEDSWSMASSNATSVRTNKSKVTVPVAPKFTVDYRLERRKEYYTKLDEKHKALQKEKQDYEARIKEEDAAAIKQLRKNMVVKANPVPSFYKDGPPPKPELKKLPVTRPKSPNLNRSSARRKSCGDAVRTSEDKGFNGRASRHSVGAFRDSKYSPVTPKGKDRTGPRKTNETGKVRNRQKESKEAATDIPKAKEVGDGNNAIES